MISGQKLWVSTKDYCWITLGIAMYAFGFCAFILPNEVVIGGLAGVGSVVFFLTGIPVAITQYVLNLALLAMAFRTVGRTFVLRTIFGATMMSLFIGVFQPLFQTFSILPEGGAFMSIVLGGTCCGLGVGLVFIHNGSSGGTDIVAAMVSKHSNTSIGRVMLYVDVVVISSSFFIFGQIDKVVYGLMVLYLMSVMVDFVINTNRQAVQFTIFSPRWEEIATAINNEAHRGCTVLDGMGWYSKESVKVLLVMCRKIEAVTIFRIIKSIDNDAFITQANVNGVYGKGFDTFKLKMKNPAAQSRHHHYDDGRGNQPVEHNYEHPTLDPKDSDRTGRSSGLPLNRM